MLVLSSEEDGQDGVEKEKDDDGDDDVHGLEKRLVEVGEDRGEVDRVGRHEQVRSERGQMVRLTLRHRLR